jgi:DNA polymerase eta
LVIQKILALFPHLSSVPEDAPDGLDSSLPPPPPIDWTKAGSVFPINGETDQPQVNSQPDSGEAEEAGHEQEEQSGQVDKATWEDWALCLGAEIMAELREEVWKKLHYTCSAVSPQHNISQRLL